MSTEAVISIVGMVFGVVGIFHVLWASKQSIQTAEPDMERVRHFVESAPELPRRKVDSAEPEQAVGQKQ